MKIVVANCFTHEEFMCWARQTIVGRWPPCPVLQHPNKQPHPRWRGDGGGAVCSVYLAGVAARYLLFFSL